MGYLGNSPENQAFTPRVDYFSGNASATSFTLSFPVASVAQVQAVIENVPQAPGDAYTVSGNTITFTSAPPSGTNNIYVYYTSPITSVITPGYGTVGTAQLQSGILVSPVSVSDQLNTSTGYFDLPTGTTAQRPGTPPTGAARYNTTTENMEYYNGTDWYAITAVNTSPYSVDYLVIAGGGGGGAAPSGFWESGGGGGAGGYRTSSLSLTPRTAYTVTVGSGGAGAASNGTGTSGSNSVFSTITSTGGGGGGGGNSGVPARSGGSGGGGIGYDNRLGGAGTAGQGYAGGDGFSSTANSGAGGGGGSGSVGTSATNANGGAGGSATSSSITGSAVSRAGGGGGAPGDSSGSGGSGGGGGAGNGSTGGGGSATANTGSGGGGTSRGGSGGNGGSGVVILSIPTARYSGTTTGSPTVTTSGSNTILTYTSSGTYTA